MFAYGQTGSGKTHTMGSEYKPGGRAVGVIPEVINAIFTRIATVKDWQCTVRVGFVEIHKVWVEHMQLISFQEGQGNGHGIGLITNSCTFSGDADPLDSVRQQAVIVSGTRCISGA